MNHLRHILAIAAIIISTLALSAQDVSSSASAPVRRRATDRNARQQTDNAISQRMQNQFSTSDPLTSGLSEADLQYLRIIYRQLDLTKDANAPLYFPEQPIDGSENLFRIIMKLLVDGSLPAYEYLDGREVFTPQYQVKVKDVLDRFYIPYTEAKGSTEKNPKFQIDEADVPTNEVLTYYIIERWTFDTRHNRLRPTVEAICPVLHRAGDFGGDAVRYPMFWIKYSDIRPYLTQQAIFTSDDNNLPTSSYDDYFTMTRYSGDIYKTRNLRNQSMAQLYPDAEDRQRAQDSIQNRLDTFEKRLWTPTREELQAEQERRDSIAAAAADTLSLDEPAASSVRSSRATRSARAEKATNKRSTKTSTKKKKPKQIKESSASRSSSAVRSVRRRK